MRAYYVVNASFPTPALPKNPESHVLNINSVIPNMVRVQTIYQWISRSRVEGISGDHLVSCVNGVGSEYISQTSRHKHNPWAVYDQWRSHNNFALIMLPWTAHLYMTDRLLLLLRPDRSFTATRRLPLLSVRTGFIRFSFREIPPEWIEHSCSEEERFTVAPTSIVV
jgi:hypothetical protein